jgi:hypothetical protein
VKVPPAAQETQRTDGPTSPDFAVAECIYRPTILPCFSRQVVVPDDYCSVWKTDGGTEIRPSGRYTAAGILYQAQGKSRVRQVSILRTSAIPLQPIIRGLLSHDGEFLEAEFDFAVEILDPLLFFEALVSPSHALSAKQLQEKLLSERFRAKFSEITRQYLVSDLTGGAIPESVTISLRERLVQHVSHWGVRSTGLADLMIRTIQDRVDQSRRLADLQHKLHDTEMRSRIRAIRSEKEWDDFLRQLDHEYQLRGLIRQQEVEQLTAAWSAARGDTGTAAHCLTQTVAERLDQLKEPQAGRPGLYSSEESRSRKRWWVLAERPLDSVWQAGSDAASTVNYISHGFTYLRKILWPRWPGSTSPDVISARHTCPLALLRQSVLDPSHHITDMAWSPAGDRLATSSLEKSVHIWNVNDCRKQSDLGPHDHVPESVAFSGDGEIVAVGLRDGSTTLWNVAHRVRLVSAPPAHAQSVTCLAFSPVLRLLASGSTDETIYIWNLNTDASLRLEHHRGAVQGLAFSSDGRLLASASDDGRVRIWEATTGAYRKHLVGQSGAASCVTFDAYGWRVAAGHDRGFVSVWSTRSGKRLFVLDVSSNGVISAAAFSPDGMLLATGSESGRINLWDSRSGRHIQRLSVGGQSRIVKMAFSPDGRMLASADNSMVRLWGPWRRG